jgi:pimeloyl-ACP methyl ester carboxylesterase
MKMLDEPGVGEAFLRATTAAVGPRMRVRRFLELGSANPAGASPAVVHAMEDLATARANQPWADAAYLATVRSLLALRRDSDRFIEIERSIEVPTLVIAGRRDRMIPVAAHQALAGRRPDWTVVLLDDAGHLVMIDAPRRAADLILGWPSGREDAATGERA